ncbi:MAG: hypothetical protein P9L92_09140 [Candidatus Electryonea clarkiae]|nr:hypothetical protein [Candidatus Electryonea clarkiae]MDP8288675.1 hypothetical protein [Candidatus Electryonea clarkiae]
MLQNIFSEEDTLKSRVSILSRLYFLQNEHAIRKIALSFLFLNILCTPLIATKFVNIVDNDTTKLQLLTDSLLFAKRQVDQSELEYSQCKDEIIAECFQIQGEINDRSENSILIYGTAFPTDSDYSKLGNLHEGNILVKNPHNDAISMDSYGWVKLAFHRYEGKEYGENAFGGSVPIYVYGSKREIPRKVVMSLEKHRENYNRCVDRYLNVHADRINLYLDREEKDTAKEIFLHVLDEFKYREYIPEIEEEKWIRSIRLRLDISNQEIEKGKIGKEIVSDYIIDIKKALEHNQFDKAILMLNQAKKIEPNRPEYSNLIIKYSNLLTMHNIGRSNYLIEQSLSAFQNRDYLAAQKLIQEASNYNPDDDRIKATENKILKMKRSPQFASVLSAFPGGGQLYNRRKNKALLFSLVFWGLAGWTTYDVKHDAINGTNYRYLTFGYTVIVWYLGIQDAYYDAKSFNENNFLY